MSYIESNLMNGEVIVRQAKIHWYIFFPSVFFMLIGLIMVNSPESSGIGSLFIFIAIILFISEFITSKTTELAVTNKRVIAKHGWIVRKTMELNLSKVEGLSVDQGLMGRFLNFGEVTVNGTGGARAPLKFIAEPLELRKAVNEEFEKVNERG